jgi:hypothetical protein
MGERQRIAVPVTGRGPDGHNIRHIRLQFMGQDQGQFILSPPEGRFSL